MSVFVGATIGPIFQTLACAKKTRDLWNASYLFSYIMKQIIKEMKKDREIEFIVPYVGDDFETQAFIDNLFEKKSEVGLFHDRFIIEIKKQNSCEMLKKVNNIYIEVVNKLAADLVKDNNEDKAKHFRQYLLEYINFHTVQAEIDRSDNPIIEINNMLDCLELHKTYVCESRDCNLSVKSYLDGTSKDADLSFFIKDGFEHPERFPALLDVALNKLDEKKNQEKEQKIINQILSTFLNEENGEKKVFDNLEAYRKEHSLIKPLYQPFQKYVAIVYVDGDKVGALIKSLVKEEEGKKVFNGRSTKHFSKTLMTYAIAAKKCVEEKGGMPIYAGGDDLLFFAPVNRVLEIVEDINGVFKNCFDNFSKNEGMEESQLSLSFGIAIQYYKYPLKEALELAQEQLFAKSKHYSNKCTGIDKAAVGIRVTKHSGQYFELCVGHQNESYKQFLKLLKDSYNNQILKAIQYKLQQDKMIISHIFEGSNDEIIRLKLAAYFENNFDEEIHQIAGKEKIKAIQILMLEIYRENKSALETIQQTFSYLQYIRFMNGGLSE